MEGKADLQQKTRTAFLADLENDRKEKEKVRKFAELRASKAAKKSIRQTERASLRKTRLSGLEEPTSPDAEFSGSEDESPKTTAKSALRSAARSGSDEELSNTKDTAMRASDIDSDSQQESADEREQTGGDSGEETDQPGSPTGETRRESVALTKRSRASTVGGEALPGMATGADQK